jgi:hypothetical protein
LIAEVEGIANQALLHERIDLSEPHIQFFRGVLRMQEVHSECHDKARNEPDDGLSDHL